MSAAFQLALPGLLDHKVHKDPLARPALKVRQDPRAQRGLKAHRDRRDQRDHRGLRDRRELEWLSRFPRTPLLAIRRSFRTWEYSTLLRATSRSLATRVETTTRLLALRRCETIQSASLTMLSAR